MTVTRADVRHVASLARIAVDEDALDGLARDLAGILEHMTVLQTVVSAGGEGDASDQGDASDAYAANGAIGFVDTSHATDLVALRDDQGVPVPLAHPIASFAQHTRDGFFLVPRLSTHE